VAPRLGGYIGFALEAAGKTYPGLVRSTSSNRPDHAAGAQRLRASDVLLRVASRPPVLRLWDSNPFQFSISAPIPFPGRSLSTDAFILGIGSEEFRLARLEFDRQGILRYVQTGDFVSSSHGEYFAIDNRVVETFLEDRARALGMAAQDDDDDDLDPPKPPEK
jgi:hypothetical protein